MNECDLNFFVKHSKIKIAVTNGLFADEFKQDVLDVNGVGSEVELVSSISNADVVVFGPYGAAIPHSAPYVRVAYICENINYDGPNCDYTFRVNNEKCDLSSARIQWHALDPRTLVKPANIDPEAIFSSKDRFCAFLYSNSIPYREEIFCRLSKYKRLDAPGKSMSNMESIDQGALPGESRWETKRRFLSRYKFTLALESDIFPGYQTEKLYDAMRAFSIPIYMGDPEIGRIFNIESFVNISLGGELPYWVQRLQDFSQMRWSEINGDKRYQFSSRVLRRLRILARDQRHRWLVSKVIGSLVDQVVELDRNPDAYVRMMSIPWLKSNALPSETYSNHIWRQIFAEAERRRTGRIK